MPVTQDDPQSEDYLPVSMRSPMDRARWWAVGRRKATRQEKAFTSAAQEKKVRAEQFVPAVIERAK